MSDEEFTAYLARAKQKSDAPDAPVDPISQVLVADPTASKGKRSQDWKVVLALWIAGKFRLLRARHKSPFLM
jgi:hypothetical protein